MRWNVTPPVFTLRSYTCGKYWFPVQVEKLRPYLDIDLVTTKNNRNVFADSFEIAMPVGNVLVGDTRCNIKHNDTALALDIITISEATKFLLTSSIPYVEADCAKVGGEVKRMNLYTESG